MRRKSIFSASAAISARQSALSRFTRAWLQPTEPITTVRAYNTNLNRVLTIEVPVSKTTGPLERRRFRRSRRARTGRAHTRRFRRYRWLRHAARYCRPATQSTVSKFPASARSKHRWSISAMRMCLFVRATSASVGTETAAEIDVQKRSARSAGAHSWRGGPPHEDDHGPVALQAESPATPILGMVSPPADYRNEIAARTRESWRDRPRVAADVHAADAQNLRRHQHGMYRRRQPHPRNVVHEMARPETLGSSCSTDRASRGRHRNRNARRAQRQQLRRTAGDARAHRPTDHGRLRLSRGIRRQPTSSEQDVPMNIGSET